MTARIKAINRREHQHEERSNSITFNTSEQDENQHEHEDNQVYNKEVHKTKKETNARETTNNTNITRATKAIMRSIITRTISKKVKRLEGNKHEERKPSDQEHHQQENHNREEGEGGRIMTKQVTSTANAIRSSLRR
jgi:hypothetical protein